MRSIKFLFVIIFSLILFACRSEEPSISQIVKTNSSLEIQETTTPVPVLTATASPTLTATQTASATATVTLTQTPTVTLTPTLTPFLGFEQSQLNDAKYESGRAVFIFNVPAVSQDYYAIVDNRYYVSCSPNLTYADLLICTGNSFRLTNFSFSIEFFKDAAFTEPIYSGMYYIAKTSNLIEPTKIPWIISWAYDDGSCERGINLSCETEYRTYNGVPCMDSSCADTCGYYYSVDNCPPSGDWIAISRPPGPGWEPMDVVKP